MADALTTLRTRVRGDGARPMVTFIETTSQERTELSATTLDNSAAKIANALREEFDLDVGSRVALRIPPHWQRSAWCAGALVAGCVVDAGVGVVADADLVVAGPDEASALRADGRSVAVVSLHPFGLPISTPLPAGCTDVTLAVRQQPDAYLHDLPRPTWLRGFGPTAASSITGRCWRWLPSVPTVGASCAAAACWSGLTSIRQRRGSPHSPFRSPPRRR